MSLKTAPDASVPKTDYSRWRLKDENGRQTWHYLESDLECEKWPQTTADRYFLGLDMGLPDLPTPQSVIDHVHNGLEFAKQIQMPSGQWACEYGGPMFLLPGLIIILYATGSPIPEPWKIEITRYLVNRAHPEDGGWGLHIEGESTVFGTALNYTVLRILGMDPDHPVAVKARARLHQLGGALGSPHWGKLFLSLINCYGYDGMNPVPPELWLLPNWVPFHPWRWWIHCRQVYLPMSYLYSRRWSLPVNDLIKSLREELYTQNYNTIDFSQHRNTVAPADIYHPHSPILNLANKVLVGWEKLVCPEKLQEMARQHVYNLVVAEDLNSDYTDLGPVNNPLNMMVRFIHEGPDSHAVKMHRYALEEYMWMKDEGMLMNGTDGVQCWDTSFYIQAIAEAGLAEDPRYRDMLLKALEFLESQQILEDCKEQDKCYRQKRKGAWPFSKKKQGYTVSDCTAEALKSVLLVQRTPGFPQLVSDRRLKDSVDVLLTMQNSNDGFGSYEDIRSGEWLEHLNAAEVFGNIMVEYAYPECTTSVVIGLDMFRQYDPDYRRFEIDETIKRAFRYIRKVQRPDGSWEGSWGVCFTYAAMFALESLSVANENYNNSDTVKKAVDFLLSKQMEDGGWGESYQSSVQRKYIHHENSQVVMTAWACIALMHSGYPDLTPVERGLKLIMSRQQSNGEWLQEAIEGVFNKSCMISYPNYKISFTTKALGMYAHKFGNKAL